MPREKSKRRVGRPSATLPARGASKAQRVGKRMRELREASSDSVEKLAKKAKISVPRWYAFERGKAGETPRIERLWELERALGVEPNELAKIVYPQVASTPALAGDKS